MSIFHPTLSRSLNWRSIGPHRGGRVVAVTGHPMDPMVFYFGACAGGIWKTEDGGAYWQNISDGFFGTAAIGAIAISDSDPNVIYVGTGEACLRGNVCHGDGVYRTTDGGKTWSNIGLRDTRHISRIRVHPTNSDIVYVAALGHAFESNQERGVFRSQNGGKTWENVLFKSQKAGAVDLSISLNNPRILYAAIYEIQRYPWTLISGGPDSGLYRSTNGGDSWEEITNNDGLPVGTIGRIGVSISPLSAERVWAMIEAEEGGLYRSDDGGQSWVLVNDDADIRGRPWYYTHVFADPQDFDTVYILEGLTYKSTNEGRDFFQINTPHGDNHDLWMDNKNPKRMIHGNDGGACVSFNGGESWSSLYNQPTAQFYHVTTDDRFPYRVYGAQQDNSTISVPSSSPAGAISEADWYVVGGGESGYIAVHPDDPDIIFAGNHSNGLITKYNHKTGQAHNVMVWPEPSSGWGAIDMKYRFQWTFPITFSPHDSNILYVAGNHIFESTDGGSSWKTISPDLTRNDLTKLGPSGGPVTKDVTNAEYYCTVFSFAESPVQKGILWAGSDDGLVHVSRDGGQNWNDVTPNDLPEWALVSIIEPSRYSAGSSYLAATCYKLGDHAPYLFKTNDFGSTWEKITHGIAENDITRVIREDPIKRGLLYVGTESGVYLTIDDGGNWESIQLNLPIVPIHDLVIKDGDLVVATHGRSFWILGDIGILRQIADDFSLQNSHLFSSGNVYRYLPPRQYKTKLGGGKVYSRVGALVAAYITDASENGVLKKKYLDVGQNPQEGVLVNYYLERAPEKSIELAFFEQEGELIRSFTSDLKVVRELSGNKVGILSHQVGFNQFIWDMRYPDATRVIGDNVTGQIFDGGLTGPMILPRTYQVILNVDGESFNGQFEVKMDPRLTATYDDLKDQFCLLEAIRNKLSETNNVINQIRDIKKQLKEWNHILCLDKKLTRIADLGCAINTKLVDIEEELIQTNAKSQIDRLKFPVKLNGKLAGLCVIVSSADERPTKQMHNVFMDLCNRIDKKVDEFLYVKVNDILKLNEELRKLRILPVVTS